MVYFAVEPGTAYEVEVDLGHPGARREVVLSVDGRDALVNEPADYNRYRGLVSSGTARFKGWRVSDSAVRAFVASDLGVGGTVAERNDGPLSSIGTIAAAIFSPRVEGQVATRRDLPALALAPLVTDEHRTLLRARSTPSVGTAAGHEIVDLVGSTSFVRAPLPELLTIEYDSMASLIRRGVWKAQKGWPGMTGNGGRFCDPNLL